MGMRMGVRPRVFVQVHVLVHPEVGGFGGVTGVGATGWR